MTSRKASEANLDESDRQLKILKVSPVPLYRSFHVNGALTDPRRHYVVDVSASNQQVISKITSERAFLMLYAARGSGKTTRVFRMLEQLQEMGYETILIDFQAIGFDASTSLEHFFAQFASLTALNMRNSVKEEDIKTTANYTSWFENPNLGDRKFILVIDEFDKLYTASQSVRDNVLGLLRSLLQSATTHLYSMIAVGPFSILSLTNATASPFNVSQSIEAPNFTLEQVQQLFAQFTEERKLTMDSDVILDIWTRTAGHAGLVCFCGKVIEHVYYSKGIVGILKNEKWTEYACTTLLHLLITTGAGFEWSTIQRMVGCVQQEDYRDFIVKHFLRKDAPVQVTNTNEKQLQYLAAEGILCSSTTQDGVVQFSLRSPLIQTLLLRCITIQNTVTFPDAFPFGNTGVDFLHILTTLLPKFDKTAMKSAPGVSFKAPRGGGMPRKAQVPSEACYHFELFTLLRSWLTDTGEVYPEVNSASSKQVNSKSGRCDIFFKLAAEVEHRCVIELLASDSVEKVEKHILHCQKYGRSLRAHQSVVLNFFVSSKMTTPHDLTKVTDSTNRVQVIHIQHDLDWTQAILVCGNDVIQLTLA